MKIQQRFNHFEIDINLTHKGVWYVLFFTIVHHIDLTSENVGWAAWMRIVCRLHLQFKTDRSAKCTSLWNQEAEVWSA